MIRMIEFTLATYLFCSMIFNTFNNSAKINIKKSKYNKKLVIIETVKSFDEYKKGNLK
jgi:hypothetical protein